MRGLAATLAAKFGKSVIITYRTAGTYDVSTGASVPGTSTATVKAVVEDYDESEVAGLVEQGDIKITIPQQGVTLPKPDDTVTVDAVVHEIVNVEEVAAGVDTVLYVLQVRR